MSTGLPRKLLSILVIYVEKLVNQLRKKISGFVIYNREPLNKKSNPHHGKLILNGKASIRGLKNTESFPLHFVAVPTDIAASKRIKRSHIVLANIIDEVVFIANC